MKSTLTILMLASSLAVADPSDYVNFVRQVQTGLEWDISVAPSGSMLSAEGIDESGSRFLLYSIHGVTAKEYLLDEEFVSTYTPEAFVTVTTGDDYEAIPRTRVDQPFSVTVKVEGLLSGGFHGDSDAGVGVGVGVGVGGVPAASRMVYLNHKAFNYEEGTHTLAHTENPVGIEVGEAFLTGNGATVLNYATNHLTAPDLTKAEGEEVFTVSTLDDWGVEGHILQSAKVQIWPLADAVISGIDPNVRYADLPPISVKYNDLYPSSTTRVRIYPGPPVADASNYKEIDDSFWQAVDSVPESPPAKVLTNIDHLFEQEGAYTMEVIHTTPFGDDLLTQFYPIRVDRTVEFKGGIYTAE